MQLINYPLMPRPEYRDPTEIPVTLIERAEDLDVLLDAINGADAVAVDTETHDAVVIDGIWAAVRVISVATRHGNVGDASYQAFVIDVRDLPAEAVAPAMARIREAYAWNANFDDRVMRIFGAPIKRWHDVMLDESVLWAGVEGRGWYLSLAVAAKRYLGWDVIGKGSTQTSFTADADLSQEQIDYAGYDALVTLWLGEVIDRKLAEQGLTETAQLEQGARPFIAMMTEVGYPFSVASWNAYLGKHEKTRDEALAKIAELTGGAELTLFGEGGPRFNVNSEAELKRAFNQYEADIVAQRLGRPFEAADQTDKAMLTELKALGSELADAVLQYRAASKYVTTYGQKFLKFVAEDGRIHARYKQALTATGRLSSFAPNAQNLPGSTKAHITPGEGRILIQADYSQAELRVLACLAKASGMLGAFRSGADLHELTANQMFHIDIAELKKTDPKAAKEARTKTKRVNFGIPYGLSAGALARQLTNEGVETTEEEARALLDGYNRINPEVAAWLKARDGFVKDLAANPGPVDWRLSFRLLELWQLAEAPRKAYKRQHKSLPSALALADVVEPDGERRGRLESELGRSPSDEEMEAARQQLAKDLDWAFTYDAPVVLRPGGEPLAWESRTVSGRRRLFIVAMDSGYKRSESDTGSSSASDQFAGLVTSAMLIAATTDKPVAAKVRDEWAAVHGVALPQGTDRCPRKPGETVAAYKARARRFANEERTRCVKVWEGRKHLKTAFVKHMCDTLGADAAEFLLGKALADQIRKLGNAFRNHPIQAAVADIAEAAYAELYAMCEEFPDLVWIMSVHDSIMGECDEANGAVIGRRQKQAMERAMSRFYPDVPAKVDAEVCTSLDEADTVLAIGDEPSEEELAATAAA